MTQDSKEPQIVSDETSSVPVYLEQQTAEEIALGQKWQAEEYARQLAAVENIRRQMYMQEADPIFFKYQAGEATKEEWLAARAAVNEAHPYPEEPKAPKKVSKN